MELISTHTHTGFCGHGEGSVAEVVEAASAAGLTTVALTEHFPLSKAFDPQTYLSMPQDKLEAYRLAVEAARISHPEIEVIYGCEIDWLGADEDRDLARYDFDQFELRLGSVHFVDAWAFDDPHTRDRWQEVGADVIWTRYFEIWCESVCSNAPFDVMSHPDLPKKFAYYPSFSLDRVYRQAAESIQSSGRMIEVNTSGLSYACKEMFPALALLTEFCRAGIPCTVGTDSHKPEQVARDISGAYKLMYEAGYREVTIPTQRRDRRTIVLE